MSLETREQRAAYLKEHRGEVPEREAGAARWLVEPIVGPLIQRLSAGALGWSNATEKALRAMAWVDTGHVFGKRSIGRWIGRTHRAGRLLHKRMPPGTYFRATKRGARNGTQLNRWPTEAERRERLWRLKVEKRKARQAKSREREEQRQRKAEGERHAARNRRNGQALVSPPAPATASKAEVGASVAAVLAELAQPRAVAAVNRSALQTSSPDDHDHRARALAEIERARAWARSEGLELGPDPDDE